MYRKFFSLLLLGTLLLTISFASNVKADEAGKADEANSNILLDLGTEQGVGGEDFMKFDRDQIKNQIKTFIPPLLRPAFTQHAFVLPPDAYSTSLAGRFMSIKGSDFFKDGNSNEAVFKHFEVDRQLTDLDFFYGFDLNKKYLHGFTFRVNIPYYASQTNGHVHPNGQSFISLENSGSTMELGDIGFFLKKKLMDQGNYPFGFAIAGAVFIPTGSNDEKFGSNGRITATRPTPPNTTVAQGFDAVMAANVANGVWGDPRCFFANFNGGHRALCNNNSPFNVPAAGPQMFAEGGPKHGDSFVGDFPFNDGVFGRFSSDGRLPSVLQSGTGTYSYLLAAFLTRQFGANDFLGRSAFHMGASHKFVFEEDGIDFGDTTTYFATFVKPVYKDYLAFDLTFVAFDHEEDSYSGKIPEPEIHSCTASDVGAVSNCNAAGDEVFLFEAVNRPSFSGGVTGFLSPSLIFSPDPQIRMTLSSLIRVIDPDLGPAPESVLRLSLDVTF